MVFLETGTNLSQLHFRVHRVSETVRQPRWYMDRIDRPYTVFWYVVSGEKEIIVADKPYRVGAGDLVVFPSQVPFVVLKRDDDIPMHHFDLTIETRLGPFDLLKLYTFPVVTHFGDKAVLGRLIDLWTQLKNLHHPDTETYVPASSQFVFHASETVELLQFNALTIEWVAELLSVMNPLSNVVSMSFDSRIHKVMTYIRDHLSEKLSVKRLAALVYLSESHLNLLFRQNVNMSPMQYVRQVRLQKARELLVFTNYRLRDIAEMIGFEDQSQLSRAFRQEIGVSPTAYRKNSEML